MTMIIERRRQSQKAAPPNPRRNAMLARLSHGALSVLEPHLRCRDFKAGAVLWNSEDAIGRIYFPLSGVISIVVPLNDGHEVEVGTVGREGAAGISYSISTSITQARVLIEGAFFFMPASEFAKAMKLDGEINRLAMASGDALLMQAQQLHACRAAHLARPRFCRWLLRLAQQSESNVLRLRQKAVAQALGIQRTTVTGMAQELEKRGIATTRRGKIIIHDRARLSEQACDCCDVKRAAAQ